MTYYVLLCEGSLATRQDQTMIGLDDVVMLDHPDGSPSWLPVFKSKETARAFTRALQAMGKPPEDPALGMNRADLAKLADEMRKRKLASHIAFDPYITPAWDLEHPSKAESIERFCRRGGGRR